MTAASATRVRQPVVGALALELRPGSEAARDALPQDGAGALAQAIARDLASVSADAAGLTLTVVGAHYDPVELLRPGWPLHERIGQLGARAPQPLQADDGGRVIAFGSHQNQLPEGLAPDAEYRGGHLRVLPWVLAGDLDTVARVGDDFERDLLERGMADAATALLAQDAFGLEIEHARYLTVHDLAAMTALQYRHAGLEPLWPVLETALLAPDDEHWLDAPPEPLLHYVAGEVRIALLSPQAWQMRHAADTAPDSEAARERLQHRHQQFEARQRQFAAVLDAHGVPVTFVHCPNDGDDREALR